MSGRSLPVYDRVYLDGYDISGYAIDAGERGASYNLGESACLSDVGNGVIAGQVIPIVGPINGVLDNSSGALHGLASAANGSSRYVMVVRGVQTAPVLGDDIFCMVGRQASYKSMGGGPLSTINLSLINNAAYALNYVQHFGALIHAWGSETGANSANTNHDNGAATTGGGWLMYHIYSITGSGTVTVSIDDSANGTTWAALSGATSGAIATASAPLAGVVQLGTTATVRRYLRWQFALGGSASAAVFALGFMRG